MPDPEAGVLPPAAVEAAVAAAAPPALAAPLLRQGLGEVSTLKESLSGSCADLKQAHSLGTMPADEGRVRGVGRAGGMCEGTGQVRSQAMIHSCSYVCGRVGGQAVWLCLHAFCPVRTAHRMRSTLTIQHDGRVQGQWYTQSCQLPAGPRLRHHLLQAHAVLQARRAEHACIHLRPLPQAVKPCAAPGLSQAGTHGTRD